jgi:glycine cleavage system H protein
MSSKVPADLKYTKSHEWVRVEGDAATVGITDHAQQELTDVVFVELPALGRQLAAGEQCAVVESVKTASDVYAPVSGEVIAVNEAVTKTPALANDQPYADGWFYKVRLARPAEVAGLLAPADYAALIEGR